MVLENLTQILATRNAEIGSVTLNASVSENHVASTKISEHPIESDPGSPSSITDNIRINPLSLRIEGVVTEAPLAVSDIPEILEGHFPDRVGDAHGLLMDYLLGAQEITVVTTLKTYHNMVIESLEVTRDAKRGVGLFFFASLRQVVKVELVEEEVKAKVPEAATKAKGKKPKKPAKPKTVEKSSAAYKLLKEWITK